MVTTTTTKPPSQRGTRTPLGGKKPIKPVPQLGNKPTTSTVKKPVPAPIKPQTNPTPTPKPTVKPRPTPAKSPPSQSQPQSQPRLPTVTTASLPKSTTTTAAPETTGNWINRTVQNRIAGVGNYAGNLVNSVGDSVNKLGEGVANSITNTTRGWGQGVAGYGNNIKDQVGVGGARVATAGNPLGLAGKGASQGNQGGKGREKGKGSARNPLGLKE